MTTKREQAFFLVQDAVKKINSGRSYRVWDVDSNGGMIALIGVSNEDSGAVVYVIRDTEASWDDMIECMTAKGEGWDGGSDTERLETAFAGGAYFKVSHG